MQIMTTAMITIVMRSAKTERLVVNPSMSPSRLSLIDAVEGIVALDGSAISADPGLVVTSTTEERNVVDSRDP